MFFPLPAETSAESFARQDDMCKCRFFMLCKVSLNLTKITMAGYSSNNYNVVFVWIEMSFSPPFIL